MLEIVFPEFGGDAAAERRFIRRNELFQVRRRCKRRSNLKSARPFIAEYFIASNEARSIPRAASSKAGRVCGFARPQQRVVGRRRSRGCRQP
ncbi:hypothetical protein [Burkholderia anthina]|uniref:hypothetical protein n=1 Tax=Burkholderia anthina TaxID=179879 RepID=UPI00158E14A6|nr:hypothetical protein [Burkholderia anthina]